MKYALLIAMLFATTSAYAQQSVATPSSPPTQGAGPGGGGAGNGQQREERLDEVKAKILARIQEHQACVQAATTIDALRACHPHPEGGEGGGHGGGHGGGFGGGRPGGATNTTTTQ